MHSMGFICVSLSSSEVYLDGSGKQVKLSQLHCVARVDQDGKVNRVPDQFLVLNQDQLSTQIAPELVDANILQLDFKIDSFLFGIILYNLLFGQPPQFNAPFKDSHLIPPNHYHHYDLYPSHLIQHILNHDYQLDITH